MHTTNINLLILSLSIFGRSEKKNTFVYITYTIYLFIYLGVRFTTATMIVQTFLLFGVYNIVYYVHSLTDNSRVSASSRTRDCSKIFYMCTMAIRVYFLYFLRKSENIANLSVFEFSNYTLYF